MTLKLANVRYWRKADVGGGCHRLIQEKKEKPDWGEPGCFSLGHD